MQKPQYPRPTFQRKTPQQQQQEALARAIATAKSEQLAVIGSGRMIDGRPFWLVPSTTDSFEHHTVTQNSSQRLQCNCTAGLYGRLCKHRACVFLYLQAQAQAAKKQEAPPTPEKPAVVATVATPAQPAKPAKPEPPAPRTRAEAFGVPHTKANALPYDAGERKPSDDGLPGYLFKPERDPYIEQQKAAMRTKGAQARVTEEW